MSYKIGRRIIPMARRTLMAVLAHPDDESTTAGGTLALYASRGVHTVLVTCTNGEYGDRPYGVRPAVDHDVKAMAATRLAELRLACDHLSICDLELLGYHDSGTVDWDRPHQPTVFRNIPLERVAAHLGVLLEKYRPQVILTHEPTSTRHPDHRHASKATALAVEQTKIPEKLYYTAHGTAYWQRLSRALADNGIIRPNPNPEWRQTTDKIDQEITTSIAVLPVLNHKREAVYAHASQIKNSTAAKVPQERWAEVFGTDDHIRVFDTTNASLPEDDLFAGIGEYN
ncbi:PIG-L family deacetylase [Nocardia sp. NPDC051570]|uniref:PIG-L family deacetylase n=1 Tax=Nocardia sp. NPDC051570 TaxID=3364324 RepID=UPI0037BCDFEE